MAALNFPDSPNVNDVFTVGSREWIWDGSAWVSNSGREYTRLISDTAPSSPIEGDEWFNSSTGKLYIYYDSYWLEVGASVSGQDGADATLTRTIRSESADTSLVSGDANQVIRFTGTSAQVLTVDDVLSVGDRVEVIQDNSGQVEFSSGSGVTLLSTTGEFGSSGQNAKVEVMCVAAGEYRLYGDLGALAIEIEYLVIAGGAGGGSANRGGGGGAGGYRSSVIGESSGGGASAESVLTLNPATDYTVTVGSGGATQPTRTDNTAGGGQNGSSSVFAYVTSVGGGGGSSSDNSGVDRDPKVGGSGGGGWYGVDSTPKLGAAGTANQGFKGGDGLNSPPYGGGGGGAGQAGGNASSGAGTGGDGVQSNITGTLTYRAGGGSSSNFTEASNYAGGLGGGGIGDNRSTAPTGQAPANGGTNTGGGGGAAGNGGSGIVILRYPSAYSITIGSGLTGTENTDGDFKYAEITAGTGNVSFS